MVAKWLYILYIHEKKSGKVPQLNGILCAWSALRRALVAWYRGCTQQGLNPREGGEGGERGGKGEGGYTFDMINQCERGGPETGSA